MGWCGYSYDGWNPHSTKGGFWLGVMLTLAVKPQWVCYKLDETIEQSSSDFPRTHHKSV
jgi:hypothetical protein